MRVDRRWRWLGVGIVAGGLVLTACASTTSGGAAAASSREPGGSTTASASAGGSGPQVASAAATLLVVGDLGDCSAGGDRGKASAALAATLTGPILLLGDIAYPDGTSANYRDCFWPAWKPLRDRAHAVIGNHDDRHRAAFFRKWPNSGSSSRPWYRFRVGAWKVLVVDANCRVVGCGSTSPQVKWLRDRLAANDRCTVLAMHQPRFSSDDEHGDSLTVDTLWRTAHRGGVDLVVAGHAHDYERIGPVSVTGKANDHGPVLFVVGTGGAAPRSFAAITPASAKRIAGQFGLARLTLEPQAWSADFLAAPGGAVRDTATGGCR